MNRWPFVFVVLGLVAAGVAYDRVSEYRPEITTEVGAVDVITPSLADPPRLDSVWYCPLGTSSESGFADHEVYISNLSAGPAVANLSILTDEGQGAGRRVEVGPFGTERVLLSDSQTSDVAGAVVEVISGDGVVGHAVTTDQGRAEGPCGTQVSNEWYFASGRTELDSTQYLALMNPFPETARFNVEFRTLARSRQPQALQGAFVPARSVRIIDIGENITSEANVATIVTTERGRLVAERLQLVDGSLGAEGAALQLGVARPADSWILPAGRIHAEGSHSLMIFNPAEPNPPELVENEDGEDELLDDQSDKTAVVDVQLWPNNPTDLSLYGVVTTTREVRPGSFESLDIGAQALRFGFPLPYELGVNVLARNDLPVVVERWQVGEALQDPSDPAAALAANGDDTDDDADSMEDADSDGTDSGDTDSDGTDSDGTDSDGTDSADTDSDSADSENADDSSADDSTGDGETDSDADGEVPEGDGDFAVTAFDINGEPIPQPTADAGLSTSRGVEQLSDRWVVPWVTIDGNSTAIVIASPEEASVEVRLMTGGAFGEPIQATVPRAGRTVVPVTVSGADGAVVEITSDVPVAVEAMVVVAGESLDVVPAIPTVRR